MKKRLGTVSPLLAGLWLGSACTFEGYEGVYLEPEDLRVEFPGSSDFRQTDAADLLPLTELAARESEALNRWTSLVVDTTAVVVASLDGHRPTRREGNWQIFGPFDDEQGRDLSWLIRVLGDEREAEIEVLVAAEGEDDEAAFVPLCHSEVELEGRWRRGKAHIVFDTLGTFTELNSEEDADSETQIGGELEVEFRRDGHGLEKATELTFVELALPASQLELEDSVEYRRDANGAGHAELVLRGAWEAFGGPQAEDMAMITAWDERGASRARGEVSAAQGDLAGGDLWIEECAGASAELEWRGLDQEYAQLYPNYAEGDSQACTVPVEAL